MNHKNDINAILAKAGKNKSGFAEHLGTSKQNLYSKLKADTLRIDDLIKLAEYTDTYLAFVNKDGSIFYKIEK